jgi:hypothetical protein
VAGGLFGLEGRGLITSSPDGRAKPVARTVFGSTVIRLKLDGADHMRTQVEPDGERATDQWPTQSPRTLAQLG